MAKLSHSIMHMAAWEQVTAGTQFPIGPTQLTFVAYDEGEPSNTDSCNLTVTVLDHQVNPQNKPYLSSPMILQKPWRLFCTTRKKHSVFYVDTRR